MKRLLSEIERKKISQELKDDVQNNAGIRAVHFITHEQGSFDDFEIGVKNFGAVSERDVANAIICLAQSYRASMSEDRWSVFCQTMQELFGNFSDEVQDDDNSKR